MLENINEWVLLALAIIGGASTVVAGLEKIFSVTPSTKDDYYVGKVKRGLGVLADILSRFALNPKK